MRVERFDTPSWKPSGFIEDAQAISLSATRKCGGAGPSADRRFATVHNAVRQLSKMVIASCGYRVSSSDELLRNGIAIGRPLPA